MSETATAADAPLRARAEIDLAALRANVRALRARAPRRRLMAVVKADAYGHGAVPLRPRRASRRARTWLGTATPEEALALRAGRDCPDGRIMCWLWTPGGPWREAIEADLDVSRERDVGAAARSPRRPAPPDGPPGCSSRPTPGSGATAASPPTGPSWSPRRCAPRPRGW